MTTATLERPRFQNGRPQLGFPTTWEMIDPELAALYLELNTDNRKKNRRTSAAYAAAMARGEWMANGDAIRFSSENVLINGQHTLQAIIDSKTTQLCLVIRGLPPEAYRTIDRQKRRSDADDAAKAGYANATSLTATIRLLWAYECAASYHLSPERRLTTAQVLQFAEAIPELSSCVNEVEARRSRQSRILPGCIGSVLWFATRGMPAKRDEFFSILRAESPATRRNPAFALRERFAAELLTRRRTLDRESLALTIKAWNYCHDGREVGTLKISPNEVYPRIKGYGDELSSTFPEWMASAVATAK